MCEVGIVQNSPKHSPKITPLISHFSPLNFYLSFIFIYNTKVRNYRKSINLKILTSILISDFLITFYLSSFLLFSIVLIASFNVTETLFIADSRFANMLSAYSFVPLLISLDISLAVSMISAFCS